MEEDKKGRKLASSSMVDLKAELFRKQEEFKRQKQTNAAFIKAKKSEKDKKSNLWSKQNSGVLARAQRDLEANEKDVEEEEMLAKSRRILEQKSKVYDSFTSKSAIPEEDGSEYYLVDFQKKAIDALVEEREAKRRLDEQKEEDEAERKVLAEEIPEASCPEDEWVDFVDSLGRERRCMKKDLHLLMKKDQELALAQAKKKLSQVKAGSSTAREGSSSKTSDELPHLMSQDMHREMMRQKWENEAKEMLDRGQDEVHYSNVQFDEIRAHGVGYYQFSKDHSKRQEELEKLQKLREETKSQQSSKEKIKDKRKAMLEARLAKVRQRRGLKAEVKEEDKQMQDDDKESIGPKLDEAVLSSSAEESRKKEEAKEAEEKRKNHVREWDKEKVESNTWGVKNYVTARREERENEFAPPSLYFDEKTKTSKFGNSQKTLTNVDRLNRLKDSISSPSIKEDQTFEKDKSQQSAASSTLPCFDEKQTDLVGSKTQSSPSSSNPIDSIPLPDEPVINHREQISQEKHFLSQPPPAPAANPQHQRYQPDSAVSQFYSGEQFASNSWQNWNFTQGTTAQPQHHYQSGQEVAASHQWYPSQHNAHYLQQYSNIPVGQGCQSAQPYVHTVSHQHNHYSSTSNSVLTSNQPLTVTPTQPTLDKAADPDSRPVQNDTPASDEPPPPKKPRVPKHSVVDMRFMNNFDTSSINPEPGRVPDVGGVPYKPGSFSKYRPQGVDSKSDAAGEGQSEAGVQDGAQISGGPLIYTKEQLARQQQELDEQEEESAAADSDDERKVQDFLSSIRASSK